MGMGGGMGGTPPAGPISGQVSGALGMDPGVTYQLFQSMDPTYVDPRIEFADRLRDLGELYAPIDPNQTVQNYRYRNLGR